MCENGDKNECHPLPLELIKFNGTASDSELEFSTSSGVGDEVDLDKAEVGSIDEKCQFILISSSISAYISGQRSKELGRCCII